MRIEGAHRVHFWIFFVILILGNPSFAQETIDRTSDLSGAFQGELSNRFNLTMERTNSSISKKIDSLKSQDVLFESEINQALRENHPETVISLTSIRHNILMNEPGRKLIKTLREQKKQLQIIVSMFYLNEFLPHYKIKLDNFGRNLDALEQQFTFSIDLVNAAMTIDWTSDPKNKGRMNPTVPTLEKARENFEITQLEKWVQNQKETIHKQVRQLQKLEGKTKQVFQSWGKLSPQMRQLLQNQRKLFALKRKAISTTEEKKDFQKELKEWSAGLEKGPWSQIVTDFIDFKEKIVQGPDQPDPFLADLDEEFMELEYELSLSSKFGKGAGGPKEKDEKPLRKNKSSVLEVIEDLVGD